MIIEIKDLPNGQLIKHMIIDVQFHENGEVKDTQTTCEPVKTKFPEPPKLPISPPTRDINDDILIPTRTGKEIPAEMLELEL